MSLAAARKGKRLISASRLHVERHGRPFCEPRSPDMRIHIGYFCREKDLFPHGVDERNYFEIRRDPFVGDGTIVLFGDGEEIMVFTEKHKVRFLLISGNPIGEPVAWYGPIVMNTQEDLRVAFEDYRQGTFIKCKG